jgi:hypothetical protein
MAEVGAWQARPLEPMYPVIFFDALRVKIREDSVVRNKAIYLALGVLPDGTRACDNQQRRASLGQRGSVQSKSDKSHAGVSSAPQLIACGDDETPEFKRQSDQYVASFGYPMQIRRHVVQGHHFDVLNECGFQQEALRFFHVNGPSRTQLLRV